MAIHIHIHMHTRNPPIQYATRTCKTVCVRAVRSRVIFVISLVPTQELQFRCEQIDRTPFHALYCSGLQTKPNIYTCTMNQELMLQQQQQQRNQLDDNKK